MLSKSVKNMWIVDTNARAAFVGVWRNDTNDVKTRTQL